MIQKEILGACLVSKSALETATTVLNVDDFKGNNKEIFRVMLELVANNKPVDLITVSQRYSNIGYLASLNENAIAYKNIKTHCEELINNNKKAALEKNLLDTIQCSNSMQYDEIIERLEKLTTSAINRSLNPEIRDLDNNPCMYYPNSTHCFN